MPGALVARNGDVRTAVPCAAERARKVPEARQAVAAQAVTLDLAARHRLVAQQVGPRRPGGLVLLVQKVERDTRCLARRTVADAPLEEPPDEFGRRCGVREVLRTATQQGSRGKLLG